MLSKTWKIIKIILLTFIMVFGSTSLAALALCFFGENSITLYGEYIVLPILYLLIYLNTKNVKQTCKFNKINLKLALKSIIIALGLAMLSSFIINFLTEILHIESEGLTSNVTTYTKLIASPIGLISMCIITPICEEMVCRGFLLTKLSKFLNIRTAIIIQAMFFAFLHGNVIQFADTLIVGIVFGYVCYYTKSLFPSIIMHMTNNTLASFLNGSWFDNRNLLTFTLALLLFFIGFYTLWSVINEYKNETLKEVSQEN